jgi:hypothetical protein
MRSVWNSPEKPAWLNAFVRQLFASGQVFITISEAQPHCNKHRLPYGRGSVR